MALPPEEIQQQINEMENIHNGMLSIMLNWADLENALCLLLGTVIKDPSNTIASAIYFAPTNTETRMGIVTATLKASFAKSRHFALMNTKWKKVINRFSKRKLVRNKVAHGQIITFFRNGKSHIRLTSPMFDFSKHGAEGIGRGQKPGLGAGEIANAAKKTQELTLLVHEWAGVVKAAHEGDDAALLQKLESLEASPPNTTPQ